jgi:hypothetical protein
MKQHPLVENATLKELVNQVIWESVMENTAHQGWSNFSRDTFVKNVQDSVSWALEVKLGKNMSDSPRVLALRQLKILTQKLIDGHDPGITMDTRECLEVFDRMMTIINEQIGEK